jgi:hypothetical protein
MPFFILPFYGTTMSHHDVSESPAINEEVAEANSRADALAMLSLVVIIVTMMVYFVSR